MADKTLSVSPQVHRELCVIKATKGHKSMDSLLRELISVWRSIEKTRAGL